MQTRNTNLANEDKNIDTKNEKDKDIETIPKDTINKNLIKDEKIKIETKPQKNNEFKKFEKVEAKLSKVDSKASKKVVKSLDPKVSYEMTKNKTNKLNIHSKIKHTSDSTPKAFYNFLTSNTKLDCQKQQSKKSFGESKFSFCCPSKTKIKKSDVSTRKCNNQVINCEIPRISLKFQKCYTQ